MTIRPRVEKPDYVPQHLVVDFDFFRPGPEGTDPFEAWDVLRGCPPIVWTPHNGGHWIATSGEDIPAILSDDILFSTSRVFIDDAIRPRAVPLEYDEPEHSPLRKLIQPAFLPRQVRRWSEEARQLAIKLIEDFKGAGRCDFIADFAQQLPMIIFLDMMGLPHEHREKLVRWVNAGLRSTDPAIRLDARNNLHAYIEDLVDRRIAQPGDDILSQAITADMGGRKMSRDEALGLASGLLGGGLDTVASTMGWIALFLAENPGHRITLVNDPARIPKAIEELMRRFSIPNMGRVVKQDVTYRDAPLKAGEHILLAACIHGLDPQSFDCPHDVRFDRRDSYRHSNFGHGTHRCVGAPLAVQEIKIFLEEWLARIPEFWCDPEDPPRTLTGIVHGLERLSLRWAV